MSNTFYLVAAMTIYAVVSWFVIAAMIQGVRMAMGKPGFRRGAFIGGWCIFTLAALTYGLTHYNVKITPVTQSQVKIQPHK